MDNAVENRRSEERRAGDVTPPSQEMGTAERGLAELRLASKLGCVVVSRILSCRY